MSNQPKSKGLFDNVLNLVSNRDEKAAIEALQKHVTEIEKELEETQARANGLAQRADIAERKAAQLEATLAKGQTDNQGALGKLQAENAALQQRLSAAEAKAQLYDAEQKRLAMDYTTQEAEKKAVMATHTLTSEETLSHLALKYYGHATEPYWRIIYEANKDVIGEKPNRVRAGMVVKIPVLPADMKK